MAEIESAEELVYRLDALGATSQAAIVRERDTAIREAAKLEGKRELLAEIRALADRYNVESGPIDVRHYCFYKAFLMTENNYTTPATETQPAQDGERRQ